MKNILKKNKQRAFSLVELAIVITIISVFIAGVMNVGVGVTNNSKVTVTKNKMNEIYKALGNYAAANGRFPCPAPVTNIKGDANYGNNQTNGLGSCFDITSNAGVVTGAYSSTTANTLMYGMIPVQNLKLSSEMAEDGFGTKFGYVIDRRFTGFNENGTINNFKNGPESSVITINEVGSTTETVTNGAAFVIVSYGANKKGGFNASASTQNGRSADTDELSNDLGTTASPNFDATFVSLSDKSDVFDDILFYKTKKNIMTDFNLLSLVPCQPTGTNYNDVYVDNSTTLAAWLETDYGQVAVSSLACDRSATNYNGTVVYPTKKCGPFGVWQAGAIDSCQ
jgi:prepilin-type N-terminal cleavage/methylation domain-containing protein